MPQLPETLEQGFGQWQRSKQQIDDVLVMGMEV